MIILLSGNSPQTHTVDNSEPEVSMKIIMSSSVFIVYLDIIIIVRYTSKKGDAYNIDFFGLKIF